MTENNEIEALEKVVAKAHEICDLIMLFEAIQMEEDEVRLFLDCNNIADNKLQDMYLNLVREYDFMTSNNINREVSYCN